MAARIRQDSCWEQTPFLPFPLPAFASWLSPLRALGRTHSLDLWGCRKEEDQSADTVWGASFRGGQIREGIPSVGLGCLLELGGSQDQRCLDTHQRFHSGRVWARERLQVLEWRASEGLRGEAGAVKCRQQLCSKGRMMSRKGKRVALSRSEWVPVSRQADLCCWVNAKEPPIPFLETLE